MKKYQKVFKEQNSFGYEKSFKSDYGKTFVYLCINDGSSLYSGAELKDIKNKMDNLVKISKSDISFLKELAKEQGAKITIEGPFIQTPKSDSNKIKYRLTIIIDKGNYEEIQNRLRSVEYFEF